MNYAILGSGYIGTALAKFWLAKGVKVRCSTTTPDKAAALRSLTEDVQVFYGNDSASVARFLQDVSVLAVMVAPGRNGSYRSTYLETALTVARASKTLRYLLYTSSTSVYGNCSGEWVDEQQVPQPESESGRILLEAENAYRALLPKTCSLCILRLGGIYGPGRTWEERISRMQGQTLPGSGASYTNMIHQEDIVAAIDWCVEHGKTGVYNLVNDEHVPRKELYDRLAERLGVAPVSWDEAGVSLHAGNKRVSNEKIKQAGFHFAHPHL